MAEIRKGASWASLTALLIGIGLVAYLAWSATHKTDTENYAKGSTHYETTIAPIEHGYPLSCAKFTVTQTPDGIRYSDKYIDKMKMDMKK